MVELLSLERPLLPKHKDHALSGEFKGYRDYHIKPDLVLVYRINKTELELALLRVGTHSQIFG